MREAITAVFAEGEEFAGVDWEAVHDAEFVACSFVGSNLSTAQLTDSRFVDCRFERCDLSLWRPTRSVFGGCQFEDSRMLGVDWTGANWPAVPLHDANTFVGSDLSMNTFNDLALGPVKMEACRLREASFRFTRMPGAILRGSDCSGADFHGADLAGCNLVEVTGLVVDPRATKLEGATVDGSAGAAILEVLGIHLDGSS